MALSQRHLRDTVRRGGGEPGAERHVRGGDARRERYDLLCGARAQERQEGVDSVDDSDDVRAELVSERQCASQL